MTRSATPKETVSRYFFRKEVVNGSHTGIWWCRFCTDDEGQSNVSIKKERGSGWTNTFNHVAHKHSDYQTIMKNIAQNVFALPPAVKNIQNWIRLVVELNLPLSIVDEPLIRQMTHYDPICSNTLKKHMELLLGKVEQNVKNDLPPKFGILLDGWKHKTWHYVAIFACYSDEKGELKAPLLAFQPIPDCNEDIKEEYEMTAIAT